MTTTFHPKIGNNNFINKLNTRKSAKSFPILFLRKKLAIENFIFAHSKGQNKDQINKKSKNRNI